MVFNSLEFIAFFLVVYALYLALPHRAQNWMLLAASYVFYGAWDWRFLSLLVGSTVVDFTVARWLVRTSRPDRRRLLLILSLAFNLGMLGFFKYFDFFAATFVRLAGWFGLHPSPFAVHVVLPIGISFYTFMTISYVVDVYRREIQPTDNFGDFALFVAYFPHLVAGPILRASLLLPQIARPRVISSLQVTEGLWLIAWGYFLKLFLADNLADLVASVFDASATPRGGDVLVASYAFALQIFGDFAGYSNIARGLSKLMGIELNVNFRFPYFVTSPQAFWRHWHISLSTWLRDYLYIPLGGSRYGTMTTYRNLMITMLLGGLWHGAAWTFVVWGAYQGLALVVGRLVATWADRAGLTLRSGVTMARVTLGLLMFHVTCFGWVIFRAHSARQVADFARQAVVDPHISGPVAAAVWETLIPVALPWLVVHVLQATRDSETAPMTLSLPVRYAVYGGVFYLVLLFGDFQGAQFIYFQF
jgi:D-alanyl-lipoteichoic acid acyltransferase DltB (MBOAT superfamily)